MWTEAYKGAVAARATLEMRRQCISYSELIECCGMLVDKTKGVREGVCGDSNVKWCPEDRPPARACLCLSLSKDRRPRARVDLGRMPQNIICWCYEWLWMIVVYAASPSYTHPILTLQSPTYLLTRMPGNELAHVSCQGLVSPPPVPVITANDCIY
jgi:hypothetical protein